MTIKLVAYSFGRNSRAKGGGRQAVGKAVSLSAVRYHVNARSNFACVCRRDAEKALQEAKNAKKARKDAAGEVDASAASLR